MNTGITQWSLACSMMGCSLLACVEDDGNRPKTSPAETHTDPGSGQFDCMADAEFEYDMFDDFEFGAALGTWYANNDICEDCQTLLDQRAELAERVNDPDAGVGDTDDDALTQLTERLFDCRVQCKASQFPTIFDKPLPADSISGTRCGSAYAFHLTTTPGALVDWGANWGTAISPPFDGREWKGISFWARRAPDSRGTVRVEVSDRFTDGNYTDENGKAFCSPDYTNDTTATGCDRFGKSINVGTDWQFFTLPFEELRQAGWGVSAPYFDVEAIRSLTFLFPAGYWDIWIDEVAFYRQREH